MRTTLHRVKRRHVAPLAGVVAALFLLPLARLVVFSDEPGRFTHVIRNHEATTALRTSTKLKFPALSVVDPNAEPVRSAPVAKLARVKAAMTSARAQRGSPVALASAEKVDVNGLLLARSPEALDEHALLLEDSRRSMEVRETAARVLGATRSPQSLALLMRATRAPDAQARRLAARALGEHSDSREAYGVLQGSLSDADPAVRIAAAGALGGWPDAALTLEQRLVAEPRLEVQLACLDALGRAGGREQEARLVAWSTRPGTPGERATSALEALRARLAESESPD